MRSPLILSVLVVSTLVGCRLAETPGASTALPDTTVVDTTVVLLERPTPQAFGGLQERIDLSLDRLLHGEMPAFTESFLLADVALDPATPRRFTNYSGDLSGRYLSALAALPAARRPASLDALVARILSHQRPDGRFGDPDLAFTADAIGGEHMALLWGNGRLLVGLLDFHRASPTDSVLASAVRLGAFLRSTVEASARPDVAERLKELGPQGYICFTQLNEGFARLAEASGDSTYLDDARRASEALLPRGNQHSHGYLTTLRGALDVYRQTGDEALLRFVRTGYDALTASGDVLVYGGVPEYFGSSRSGHARDEGCSVADFVGLSFLLWDATGDAAYLERAEHGLLNHLFFNQYETGDFGHHTLLDDRTAGFRTVADPGRAWWCCTMHGLRFLRDAEARIASRTGDTLRVHLFLDTDWSDDRLAFSLRKDRTASEARFRLTVDRADGEHTLAVRRPRYTGPPSITLNGAPVEAELREGYLHVTRAWKPGDALSVTLPYRTRLVTTGGDTLGLDALGAGPVAGHLFHGPYLLGVDDALSPLYFGEPSQGNVLLVGDGPAVGDHAPASSTVREGYLTFAYRHEGFFETGRVTLRPISELTFGRRANVRVLFDVRGAVESAR